MKKNKCVLMDEQKNETTLKIMIYIIKKSSFFLEKNFEFFFVFGKKKLK